jgi:HSP20 family molecular chaperone IbpA
VLSRSLARLLLRMHLWLLAEFVLPEASVVILRGGGSYPPVNVFRKGEDLVIIAELRGVKKSTSTSR